MTPCACSSPGAPPDPGLSAARPRHSSPFQQSRASRYCAISSPRHKLLMPSAQAGARAWAHSPGTAPAERSPPSSTGRRAQLAACVQGATAAGRGQAAPLLSSPGRLGHGSNAALKPSTAFPEMPLTARATQANREETADELLPLQRGVPRADASADCSGSSSCLS